MTEAGVAHTGPRRTGSLPAATCLAAGLCLVTSVAGCRSSSRAARGSGATTTSAAPGATDVTGGPAGPGAAGSDPLSTTEAPATTAPGAAPDQGAPPAPRPAPGSRTRSTYSPAPGGGGLRLAGNDLGVTRSGAPLRDGINAVSGVLGQPAADPAPDTACIGAEVETSWEGFRLAGSGGKVSGWLSTSSALSTPAGVIVGSTMAAVMQAYGAALRVSSSPEAGGSPVFVVTGTGLSGTLSGPNGSVTSISNGTCGAT